MSDSQAKFMQTLLEALTQALQEKDLHAMEKLLQQGASMARQMLEGK